MKHLSDPVERAYAHFHRKLAELLQELAAEADPYWLAEAGHDIRGDHQANTYRPAIYRLRDPEQFRADFEELGSVQAHVLALTGRTKPGKNLLPPLRAQDVRHIRIGRHTGQTGRTITVEQAIARIGQLEEIHRASLREFERYATPVDARRKQVASELKTLERASGRLRRSNVTHVRETYRQSVVRPYVYFLDGTSLQLHMRDAGLLATGPEVTIEEGSGIRRRRSDRISLEPLVRAGSFEFHDLSVWEAARERGKASERPLSPG